MNKSSHNVWIFLITSFSMCVPLPTAMGQVFILNDFDGYTEFGIPSDLGDSALTFSVYENTDGDWTDNNFGTSLNIAPLTDLGGHFSGVDASAKYLFTYQVVNTDAGTVDSPLRAFSVSYTGSMQFTSGGFFADTTLSDYLSDAGFAFCGRSDPITGSNHSPFDCGDFPLGFPDTPGDHLPSSIPIRVGAFVPEGGTTPPASINSTAVISNQALFPGQVFNAVQFNWDDQTPIPLAGHSPILFLTSNVFPQYQLAATSTGSDAALGDVPSIPEPTSWHLLVYAAIGLRPWRTRMGSR